MRVLWDNEFDKYTITPVSAHANYPAENVQDTRLSRYTRTVAVSNQAWKINMAAGQEFTCCVIAGHNITSGATIKIQASNDDFGTTPFDEAIPHSADAMFHWFTPGASYKDWRFTVHDAGNGDLYIKISRLFLGTYLTVEEGPHRAFTEESVDTSRSTYSPSGQVYGDEGIVLRRYNLNFKYWTQSMIEQLKTMFDSVKTVGPFFLIIDPDNQDKIPPLYCRIESHGGYSHLSAFRYTGNLTFMEAR